LWADSVAAASLSSLRVLARFIIASTSASIAAVSAWPAVSEAANNVSKCFGSVCFIGVLPFAAELLHVSIVAIRRTVSSTFRKKIVVNVGRMKKG
jgi:hypothetical protein